MLFFNSLTNLVFRQYFVCNSHLRGLNRVKSHLYDRKKASDVPLYLFKIAPF